MKKHLIRIKSTTCGERKAAQLCMRAWKEERENLISIIGKLGLCLKAVVEGVHG